MSNESKTQWQFAPTFAILAASALSVYFGYFEGDVLRAKLPLAGWLAPAFPLICLLAPEKPETKPGWPAEDRRKLERSYAVIRVTFAWVLALACIALATASETTQAFLLIALSCCLGAIAWAGRTFSAARKAILAARSGAVSSARQAQTAFFEDACPHCQAKLAIFPEDGDIVRCACGAVLKIERSGSGGSLSVAELP